MHKRAVCHGGGSTRHSSRQPVVIFYEIATRAPEEKQSQKPRTHLQKGERAPSLLRARRARQPARGQTRRAVLEHPVGVRLGVERGVAGPCQLCCGGGDVRV
jgi:hypothetical protein